MALENLLGELALDQTLQDRLPQDRMRLAVQADDSTDVEYTSVATSVTSAGDTVLYTPAAGKRVRLHWIYAVNDPVAETSTLLTVKLGTQVFYVAWAISKRQRFTGPIDGQLIINLSAVGQVAVTAFVEEI